MPRKHIHFVTGRLAAPSLRSVLAQMGPHVDFDYSIGELGITVAALMTPAWVARKIQPPPEASQIMLPGYCHGDLAPVEHATGKPAVRGPKDLRDLPEFFGQPKASDYGKYDIEILAEINHAPRLPLAEILRQAESLRSDGADLIDIGCDPGETWSAAADCVRALRDAGHRVSIDSYNPAEIEPAVRAGAELVLSVNRTNCEHAADWGCEVVAVPDVPGTLEGLDETLDALSAAGIAFRLDPVLEPIGFGFAPSLGRYLEARRRWPEAEMLMGIGNLTELTDCDSAAMNVLLLGFCQELGIRSVLTTQVINWARSSVRECDLARRLVYHAVTHRTLPKHVEPRLVMLRDSRVRQFGAEQLERLADQIKDHNYRVLVEQGELHVLSAGLHLRGIDPYEIFQRLLAREPKNLDAGHAFYLGYEMAKAVTALTLGKDYRQDEALDWGFLTVPEVSHRGKSHGVAAAQDQPPAESPETGP
jgi:dihydropteroate synthase-like protein